MVGARKAFTVTATGGRTAHPTMDALADIAKQARGGTHLEGSPVLLLAAAVAGLEDSGVAAGHHQPLPVLALCGAVEEQPAREASEHELQVRACARASHLGPFK
jgi:hypothetical protein